MIRKPKGPSPSDEARALARLASGPLDDAALARLREALRSPHGLVVARAAGVARDRRLDGFTADLVAAFDRFRDLPAKSDPGCAAKLALLEALDFTDAWDAKPFLAGARLVQHEPAWGSSVDTAGPVRARAILALANLGYEDILLLAGELLADPEPAARQAAADALAHCGARAGAGLLLLALVGESHPAVQLACLSGLLALAPDWGLPRLRLMLFGADPALREAAAIALGESRQDDALDLLIEFVEQSPVGAERAVALRAMALHRSDRALEALLAIVASGRSADAAVAVRALAARRLDPAVEERVRAAVAARADTALEKALAEAFDEDPSRR